MTFHEYPPPSHFSRYQISYEGYEITWECSSDGDDYHYTVEATGNVYPTQKCIEKYQKLCGKNYRPQITPGEPGCLEKGHKAGIAPLWMDLGRTRVVDKPWAKDGLTAEEFKVAESLDSIYRHDESAALHIVDMPFLATLDALDLIAIESLSWLGKDFLQQVISHPSLRGGITDDWTDTIATFKSVVLRTSERGESYPRELIDTLLDPEQTSVVRRSITLPIAGEVTLSVVWPNPGDGAAPRRAMDILELSTRRLEGFMGVAFPQKSSILLVADATPHGGEYTGDGIFITIYGEDREVIAHENAHNYWTSWPTSDWQTWIIEGAATFLQALAHIDPPDTTRQDDCGPVGGSLIQDIADWVRIEKSLTQADARSVGCNYLLGARIFHDLYESLGDEAFRQGFRRLYLNGQDEFADLTCVGIDRGLCQIKAAFVSSASPREAAIAEKVINRNYHGSSQ